MNTLIRFFSEFCGKTSYLGVLSRNIMTIGRCKGNMKNEFDLEFAMSQIFSKRQKELFLKKIIGERMTKTECEYYSRSVKKKVLALANPDLHRLAEKLVKK